MIWSSRLMSPEFLLGSAWCLFAFHKLRTRVIVSVLLGCCGMLQGCIVLPVPRSGELAADSRAEIPKALKEQIVPEKSTRVDVLLLLGAPDGRVDERGHTDRAFIYNSRSGRGGVGWVMLWGIPAYAASQGGAVKLGNWENVVHQVIIHFDDAGVVTDVSSED